jgi:hypothetical protein
VSDRTRDFSDRRRMQRAPFVLIVGQRALCRFEQRAGLARMKMPPPQNFLNVVIFSNGAHGRLAIEGCVIVVLRGGVAMTDLQTKVEKYETKAAQCNARVAQATEGPQRAFYEVLANYYGGLATDFRQVIEKRKVA